MHYARNIFSSRRPWKSSLKRCIWARVATLQIKTPVKVTTGARRLKIIQGGKNDMELEEQDEEEEVLEGDVVGILARERASKRQESLPTN